MPKTLTFNARGIEMQQGQRQQWVSEPCLWDPCKTRQDTPTHSCALLQQEKPPHFSATTGQALCEERRGPLTG
ncbi:hypothetical protein NKDENANG_04004 [Candidatus Entotheonellaceae bacterium PAL068K]